MSLLNAQTLTEYQWPQFISADQSNTSTLPVKSQPGTGHVQEIFQSRILIYLAVERPPHTWYTVKILDKMW